MTATRARRGRVSVGMLLGLWLVGGAASAADSVAVLTELRVGSGEVRVRRSGESDWSVAQPLLALRPGDQIQATGSAQAVVVFVGGDVQTVSAGNSPLGIQPPRGRTGTQSAQVLLGGVIQFLLGQQREARYEPLSVRGPALTPRIVSPRETRLFAGPVTFEWTGPASLRYAVKVMGPQGMVWEQGNLPRQPVPYPASATPLRPGTRYTWALITPGQSTQEAKFEILSPADADRIRAALDDMSRNATLTAYPATTAAVMRVGLLLREELYADARRALLDGIAAEPSAATYQQLLGYVYERTGLDDLAVLAYEEAGRLSTPKP
jgi:hypothetical protein